MAGSLNPSPRRTTRGEIQRPISGCGRSRLRQTPLGRVRAFTVQYGEDALKPEHIRAAQEGRPLLP